MTDKFKRLKFENEKPEIGSIKDFPKPLLATIIVALAICILSIYGGNMRHEKLCNSCIDRGWIDSKAECEDISYIYGLEFYYKQMMRKEIERKNKSK